MPIGPRLNIASAPKCQRPCHAADVCTWVFCHEVRIDSEGNDPPETQEAGNVKTDTRPFAIVMLPPSEEGCGIALERDEFRLRRILRFRNSWRIPWV